MQSRVIIFVTSGGVHTYKHRGMIGWKLTHKHNLPAAVMETIKPIFKDLANTELLKKCLQGCTQNANESFNGTLWKLCPKMKNHGAKTVNISLAISVSLFNDGASSFEAILREMDIQPGRFIRAFCEEKDMARVSNAER